MYVLAATTDQWLAFLTPLMFALSILLQRRSEKKATKAREEVKDKVAEVKTDLQVNTMKTEATKTNTDKIHKQLNGERSILLHTIASAFREVADVTGKPEHLARADSAERVAAEHDANQG